MRISRRQTLMFGATAALSSVGRVADATGVIPSLAVIVARDSSIESLSLFQLKRIFLGDQTRNPAGRRLMPLNRGAKTSERITFDRRVLDMSPDQVARYWVDRRIRGQSGAPRAIDPTRLLQRVIARFPEAIGYAYSDQLSDEVRSIRIDGCLPDDPRYPLLAAPQDTGLVVLRM